MTDCAAIVPAPLTSSGHVARAANQPMYSGPARDSAAPNPSTQGSFYGPRDTCSARISDMEDHPPLLMDRAVYPQFSLHHERLVTFTNWPLATIFHPEDLVMQGFYYAGNGFRHGHDNKCIFKAKAKMQTSVCLRERERERERELSLIHI